ncbi:MAG: OmpH family outer membrane protein [Aestuariivita sp.]|nr:OmpH family outer membrane protein [Aestuariivita sp.]
MTFRFTPLPFCTTWLLFIFCVVTSLYLITSAKAQQVGTVRSSILIIELERLFTDSQFGKKIALEIELASVELAKENRLIESRLEKEEKRLTERRETMTPTEFRTLADEFDSKVQEIRQAQDGKVRELNQRREIRRGMLLQLARPILEQLMRDSGAAIILERSSVFLSANAIDVTDLAIARIDARIGDGSKLQ